MKFRYYAFKLSGLMVLVFLIQIFIPEFTNFFALVDSAYFEFWRFLTSIFLHAGLGHLMYNLFALLLFGSILEKLISGKKFLILFFTSGILANLVSVNFYSFSLGASGAIFGIIGALIYAKPLLIVWAFGLPMPIFFAGILWGIGDLIGAVGYLAGNPIDNTGNIAHLSGMFFGLVLGALIIGKLKKRKNTKSRFKISDRKMEKWEKAYLR